LTFFSIRKILIHLLINKNNKFYDRSRKTFTNYIYDDNELYIYYLFISLSTTKRVVKMSTKNEYKKSKERKLNAYWQHFALNILTTVTEFNFYVSNERNAL